MRYRQVWYHHFAAAAREMTQARIDRQRGAAVCCWVFDLVGRICCGTMPCKEPRRSSRLSTGTRSRSVTLGANTWQAGCHLSAAAAPPRRAVDAVMLAVPTALDHAWSAAAAPPFAPQDAVLGSTSAVPVQPSPMPVSTSKALSHAAPPAHETQLTELEGVFAAQRARVACLRHSIALHAAAPRRETLEATLAAATTEADKTALRLLNTAIVADNPDRALQLVSACVPPNACHPCIYALPEQHDCSRILIHRRVLRPAYVSRWNMGLVHASGAGARAVLAAGGGAATGGAGAGAIMRSRSRKPQSSRTTAARAASPSALRRCGSGALHSRPTTRAPVAPARMGYVTTPPPPPRTFSSSLDCHSIISVILLICHQVNDRISEINADCLWRDEAARTMQGERVGPPCAPRCLETLHSILYLKYSLSQTSQALPRPRHSHPAAPFCPQPPSVCCALFTDWGAVQMRPTSPRPHPGDAMPSAPSPAPLGARDSNAVAAAPAPAPVAKKRPAIVSKNPFARKAAKR